MQCNLYARGYTKTLYLLQTIYFFGPDKSSEEATAKQISPFWDDFQAFVDKGIKSPAYQSDWEKAVDEAVCYELKRHDLDPEEVFMDLKGKR